MSNVLFTTLSTLNPVQRKNYYSGMIDSIPLYCDGISQLEPGAKYMLAQFPIDRMVIIGSDQTYQKDEEKKFAKIENIKEIDDGINQEKAYGFLLSRLSSYMHEPSQELTYDETAVEDDRKNEIINLVSRFVQRKCEELHEKQIDEEGFFEFLAKNHLFKNLKEEIQSDIADSFFPRSEEYQYDRYKKTNMRLLEIPKVKKLDDTRREYKQRIIEIEDVLQDLQKESSFLAAVFCHNEILKNREELARVKTEYQETVKSEKADIMEVLLEENAALKRELEAIKTKRLDHEMDFAKEYLYSKLAVDKKMQPCEANKNHPISATFVNNNPENMNAIIEAIRGENNESVSVYIDMQGGSRMDSFVMTQVLSILSNEVNSQLHVEKVYTTNFNYEYGISEIQDDTSRVDINDLVSGMNAFINYGRADILKRYFDKVKLSKESRTFELLGYMIEMDESISICNVVQFEKSFMEIRTILNGIDSKCSQLSDEDRKYHADIMIEELKKDYGPLLMGEEIDFVKLIKWCLDKDFVQQAMTLIEAKLPVNIVRKGIIYYCSEGKEQIAAENLYEYILKENNGIPDWKKSQIEYTFIKSMKDECFKKACLKDKNVSSKDKGLEIDDVLSFEEKIDEICLEIPSIGIGLQRNQWDKVQKLLFFYFKVCSYRNSVNHANAKSTLDAIKDDCQACCDLYDECLKNIENNLSKILTENEIRNMGSDNKESLIQDYLKKAIDRNEVLKYIDEGMIDALDELIGQVNNIRATNDPAIMDAYISQNKWISKLIANGILGANASKKSYFRNSINAGQSPSEKLMEKCQANAGKLYEICRAELDRTKLKADESLQTGLTDMVEKQEEATIEEAIDDEIYQLVVIADAKKKQVDGLRESLLTKYALSDDSKLIKNDKMGRIQYLNADEKKRMEQEIQQEFNCVQEDHIFLLQDKELGRIDIKYGNKKVSRKMIYKDKTLGWQIL